MEIPKNLLELFDSEIRKILLSYNREIRKEKLSKISKDQTEHMVKVIYGEDKNIVWLNNNLEVSKSLTLTNKPWVYHYSLNMSWILYFKLMYEAVFDEYVYKRNDNVLNFLTEGQETYEKICSLYTILNIVDGIMESDDTIYLVKTDKSFIRANIKKIFI